MRELTRERRAAEAAEQRDARLQQMKELARERLAAETAEQRDVRLREVRELTTTEGALLSIRINKFHHFFILLGFLKGISMRGLE